MISSSPPRAVITSRSVLTYMSARRSSEIRQLLERHWTPPGVKLPGDAIDSVAAALIIRITGGNFRLLNRLLTQVERILEINALPTVTKEVVEAARENLVIGQV